MHQPLGVHQQLTGDERDLLYIFRYSLTDDKRALTKFLLSIDWDVDKEVAEVSHLLPQWKEKAPIDVAEALKLLGKGRAFQAPVVRRYAIDVLDSATDTELQLYLLQLVQALRYEPRNDELLLSCGSSGNGNSQDQDQDQDIDIDIDTTGRFSDDELESIASPTSTSASAGAVTSITSITANANEIQIHAQARLALEEEDSSDDNNKDNQGTGSSYSNHNSNNNNSNNNNDMDLSVDIGGDDDDCSSIHGDEIDAPSSSRKSSSRSRTSTLLCEYVNRRI